MNARLLLLIAAAAGCARQTPQTATTTTTATPSTRRPAATATRRDTVVVRDAETERRIARLELRLMERDAQIEELQTRLADSRDELVRTMAKLRNLTSRAEAASGMAEADVAIQALRSAGGTQTPELSQATRFQQQSAAEFNKENFGGALYLANQAKSLATTGRSRVDGTGRGALRAGESQFAVPLRLRIVNRGNVREGPGTTYGVAFAVESGAEVMAFSFVEDWIRVTDDAGRSGWIFRSLIARP